MNNADLDLTPKPPKASEEVPEEYRVLKMTAFLLLGASLFTGCILLIMVKPLKEHLGITIILLCILILCLTRTLHSMKQKFPKCFWDDVHKDWDED